MDTLPGLYDASYAAARAAARTARRAETLYPRLFVLGRTWVRQDYAGGPIIVIDQADALQLTGIGEVA